MDKVAATPRNPAWGFLADAFGLTGDFVRPRPAYLPPKLGGRDSGKTLLDPLQGLLAESLDSARRFAEDKAYGVPLLTPRTPGISSKVPQLSSNWHEQPSASGMSPRLLDTLGATPKRSFESSAQGLVDTVSNLPLVGTHKLAGMAVPKLLGGGALAAVMPGGDKALWAAHGLALPRAAEGIANSGGLISPSLALLKGRSNPYTEGPQIGFRAGAIPDPFNDFTHLTNRDGYYSNPTGTTIDVSGNSIWDPYQHAKALALARKTSLQKYGTESLELGQMFPGNSQAASIMASPKFRSFAEFESSPFGMALQDPSLQKGKQSYWDGVSQLMSGSHITKFDLTKWYKELNEGRPFADLPPHIQDIFKRARSSPSDGAELKLHNFTPIDRDHNFVFMPEKSAPNAEITAIKPLRDKGLPIFTSSEVNAHFGRDPLTSSAQEAWADVGKLVRGDGSLEVPARLSPGMYESPAMADLVSTQGKTPAKVFLPAAKPNIITNSNIGNKPIMLKKTEGGPKELAAFQASMAATPEAKMGEVPSLAQFFKADLAEKAPPAAPLAPGMSLGGDLKMQFNVPTLSAPAKSGWTKPKNVSPAEATALAQILPPAAPSPGSAMPPNLASPESAAILAQIKAANPHLGDAKVDAMWNDVHAKLVPPALAKTPTPKALPPSAPAPLAVPKLAHPGPSLASNWPSSSAMVKIADKPSGTFPGGVYKDPNGESYMLKTLPSEEHVRNEVLASKLYQAAGMTTVQNSAILHKGQPSLRSPLLEITPATVEDARNSLNFRKGMLIDAWLANWDVLGMNADNIAWEGMFLIRMDLGGALQFRAQGAKKTSAQFGPIVTELKGFGNPAVNPITSKVWANQTSSSYEKGQLMLEGVSPGDIKAILSEHGPIDPAARDALYDLLIQRRQFILDTPFKGSP